MSESKYIPTPIKTKAHKLKVLRGALTVLGPNGEHWGKHKYFGKKWREPLREGLAVPSSEVSRKNADTFCLVGALKQSATEAGFEAYSVGSITSILALVRTETQFDTVEQWNDARDRTFPDVKSALERRIAQLEAE